MGGGKPLAEHKGKPPPLFINQTSFKEMKKQVKANIEEIIAIRELLLQGELREIAKITGVKPYSVGMFFNLKLFISQDRFLTSKGLKILEAAKELTQGRTLKCTDKVLAEMQEVKSKLPKGWTTELQNRTGINRRQIGQFFLGGKAFFQHGRITPKGEVLLEAAKDLITDEDFMRQRIKEDIKKGKRPSRPVDRPKKNPTPESSKTNKQTPPPEIILQGQNLMLNSTIERERALRVLAKAKEVNKDRPVRYIKQGQSEYLTQLRKQNQEKREKSNN